MSTSTIEKTVEPRKFMLVESTQIPLKEIPYDEVKKKIIDPISGKPYKGIILEGIFADLSNNSPNNNFRFYDVPKYLELIKQLKHQMLYGRGVYGELEHPKGYAVNYKEVSHKIIDIWFDENTKYVMGRIILLDTPNGKIAEQVVRSGGLLAMSGRAAGDEIENSNGTYTAIVKLLTTFDIVYHPGFVVSEMQFKELNESQKYLTEVGRSKKGFSGLIYEEDFEKIPQLFEEYINLNENDKCFMEFCLVNIGKDIQSQNDYIMKNLSESQSIQDQQNDQQILQKGETQQQDELQDNLQKAVECDLTESKKKYENPILNQLKQNLKQSQDFLMKQQGKSYFDDSAGFIMNKDSSDITTLLQNYSIEEQIRKKLSSI